MAETYAALYGEATSAWTEATAMKRPEPDAASASHAYLASRNGLVSSSARIVSQRSSGNSRDGRDVLDAGVGDDHIQPPERVNRG